jgi:hypothetical protein
VPDGSLVRCDPGCIPRNPDPQLQLAPLTMIEERLLGVNTVYRFVCALFPNLLGQSIKQWSLRGHIIAVPNPPVDDLSDLLPLPLARIPEVLQVIFVCKARKHQNLQKLFAKAKALQIRGQEVAKWAAYLRRVSTVSRIPYGVSLLV